MAARSDLVALVMLMIPLAACAAETAASGPDNTPAVPTELDCRGGGVVGTAGGLMEAGAIPKGPDTPGQAVEGFIASMELPQHDYVVDLPEAWVLRPDGTAVARMDFLHGDGWMVYGYTLCV